MGVRDSELALKGKVMDCEQGWPLHGKVAETIQAGSKGNVLDSKQIDCIVVCREYDTNYNTQT